MKNRVWKQISALFLMFTMIITMVPTVYASTDDNSSVLETVLIEESATLDDTINLGQTESSEVNIISEEVMTAMEEVKTDSLQGITVTNITLSSDTLELKENLSASITVTLEATGADENTIFNLVYVNENNYIINATPLTYQNGAYVGEITRSYSDYEGVGTYVLRDVYGNGAILECACSSQFSYVKNPPETEAPVITDVKLMDANGNLLEEGTTLKTTDKIKVSALVTDVSGVDWVRAEFVTYSDAEGLFPIMTVDMTYDDSMGCYVGELELAEVYPTQWFFDCVRANDIYASQSYYSEYGDGYFNVESENGTEEIPEFTHTFYFYTNQHTAETRVATAKGNTTLKDLFPDDLPKAPVFEGLTFIGWEITGFSGNCVIAEDEVFNISEFNNVSALDLEPVYDKVPVNMTISYIGENKELVSETFIVPVEKGSSYNEFYTDFKSGKYGYNLDDLKHCTEVGFEGWECQNENIDWEVGFLEHFVITATYDHLYAKCFLEYYDESGSLYRDTNGFCVFFEEGTTYEEFIESFKVEDIKHYNKLQLKGWKYHETFNPFFKYEGEMSNIAIMLQAVYDKSVVDVQFNYYDENDEVIVTDTYAVVLEDAKTYDEILGMVNSTDIVHTSKLGEFTGWKVYKNGELVAPNESVLFGTLTCVATYEKPGIWIGHSYRGENCNEVTVGEVVELEAGMTKDELKEQYQTVLDNVKHSDEMTFAKWEWNDFAEWEIPQILCNAIYHDLIVVFDANGGTNLSKEYKVLDSYWEGYGHIPHEKVGELPTVEREGYEFLGWYNMPEGGTLYTSESEAWGNITLYAQWKALPESIVHTPADLVKENVIEATCTTDGKYDEVYYCKDCGKELYRETVKVPAKCHVEAKSITENVIAPSSTMEGSYDAVVYCEKCSVELKRTTISVPKVVVPEKLPEEQVTQTKNEVEDIISGSASVDEKKEIITNTTNKEAVKEALETDDDFTKTMEKFEKDYAAKKKVKIKKPIVDEEIAKVVNGNSIKVVGVGLNAEPNSTVSLNIAKPEKTVDVSEQYENAVQLDLELKVNDIAKTELDIPLVITMAIPKGVSAEGLVILHYHGDAVVPEVIIPKISGSKMTFAVDKFSTFVFANDPVVANEGSLYYYVNAWDGAGDKVKTAPKTGDSNMTSLLAIIAIAAVTVAVYRRKIAK